MRQSVANSVEHALKVDNTAYTYIIVLPKAGSTEIQANFLYLLVGLVHNFMGYGVMLM
jgi:hypothetical protein